MQILNKLFAVANPTRLFCLALLVSLGCSSHEQGTQFSNHSTIKHQTPKPSPELTFDIILHGFLLWASMGLLMPLGILTIRLSAKVECQRRLKLLVYLHVFFQFLAVLLATAGAVMSIKKFENSFDNNHKRVGLALYAAIWVQVLSGFCRRNRGSRGRSVWYILHWLLGTIISLVGIINIYTGLEAYRKKTSKSINFWVLLFSVELCFLAFLYLFQDKWEHIQKQGVILGNEPVRPSDQAGPQMGSPNKLLSEPYHKNNALGNLLNN